LIWRALLFVGALAAAGAAVSNDSPTVIRSEQADFRVETVATGLKIPWALAFLPDGDAVQLGRQVPGIIRARYRNGYKSQELLTANSIEKYRIKLGDIGHVFLSGHKIRIDISSSASPKYNVNPNTGKPISTDTSAMRRAQQTIYYGKEYPSALVISVRAN